MLSGDNGILQRATDSKEKTTVAGEKEQIQLEVLGSYEKNGNLLKNHISGIITNEATQFPLKITYTETGNTYTVDGKGNVEKKKPVIIPQGLQVGSNVTYAPTGGTYNWAAEYASADLATDGSADVNLYSTTSGTGTNMRNTSWKVFKIDEDTGDVQLIPSSPIGSLRLSGAPGYNNAVQLLDGACSTLYSHPAKGITARSIDMDDIEILLNQTKLQTEKDKYNHNNDGTGYYPHLDLNDKVETAYSNSHSYFPRIYEEENKSVINGNEKFNGFGLSSPGNKLYSRTEETSLTGQTTDSNATNGYLQASTNIQPNQTHYVWPSALGTSGNYADSTTASAYTTMLNKKYWVASRCVDTTSDYCNFNVRLVSNAYITGYTMFTSYRGENWNCSLSLLPVVTLSSDIVSADGSDFKVDL